MNKFDIIDINDNKFILLLFRILYKKRVEYINLVLNQKIRYINANNDDLFTIMICFKNKNYKVQICQKDNNIYLDITLYKFINEDNEEIYVYNKKDNKYEIADEELKELDTFFVKCYIALLMNGASIRGGTIKK